MSFILDTNAVSALMKGDPSFLAKLRSISRDQVRLPPPVVAEIAYGIERLPPSKRRTELRQRFELVLAEVDRAEWTDAVSEAYGAIKVLLEKSGQRIEDFDAAIAAHAMASGAVLISGNMKHMARIPGLRVEDWSLPTPQV